MSLKASKSKTLVLANSKVDHDAKLQINTNHYRELIPTTCSNPVKLVDCAIALDLTDKDEIEKINSAIATLTWRGFINFGYYNIFFYPTSDGN